MSKLWQRQHITSDTDLGAVPQTRMVFIARHCEEHPELITRKRIYVTGATVLNMVDAIASLSTIPASVIGPYPMTWVIEGEIGGKPFLVDIFHREGGEAADRRSAPSGYNPPSRSYRRASKAISREVIECDVVATGHRSVVDAILNKLDAFFKQEERATVQWWYKGSTGPEVRTTYLPPLATSLRPEFYPDMDDPEKFIMDYLESDAAILMLAGPPGTGKTTLLRHLICDNKLSAHIIYDEDLMRNDSVFQSFLFDPKSDVLVIEDADTVLAARETDGNTMMARFLSVSDGLIKLPEKKVVFTTNLSDFGRVDAALMRPGRCHAVVRTRELDLTEAQAACKAADLPIPIEKRAYTLAELFNQGRALPSVRRAGFR